MANASQAVNTDGYSDNDQGSSEQLDRELRQGTTYSLGAFIGQKESGPKPRTVHCLVSTIGQCLNVWT